MGFTKYFLTDKDNNGFTDKDTGLQKRIDDLKSALDYIENNKKDFNLKQTNSIIKAYEKYIRRVNISNKFLENKVNEKKFENYMLKNFSKTILKPNKINSKKKTAWHQQLTII